MKMVGLVDLPMVSALPWGNSEKPDEKYIKNNSLYSVDWKYIWQTFAVTWHAIGSIDQWIIRTGTSSDLKHDKKNI